jgi:hypothetical protein
MLTNRNLFVTLENPDCLYKFTLCKAFAIYCHLPAASLFLKQLVGTQASRPPGANSA